MKLPSWLEIVGGSQDTEIILGFYNQALEAIKVDENGDPTEDEEIIRINRFVIGLLLFNIEIYYR
jgi:hypothetical protein